MNEIARKRCFNHAHREAAARCPECGRFFCRECVTEHEDRVLCAGCLAKILEPKKKRRRLSAVLTAPFELVLGLWLAWLFFYYAGRVLLAIPDSFHEGTLW